MIAAFFAGAGQVAFCIKTVEYSSTIPCLHINHPQYEHFSKQASRHKHQDGPLYTRMHDARASRTYGPSENSLLYQYCQPANRSIAAHIHLSARLSRQLCLDAATTTTKEMLQGTISLRFTLQKNKSTFFCNTRGLQNLMRRLGGLTRYSCCQFTYCAIFNGKSSMIDLRPIISG